MPTARIADSYGVNPHEHKPSQDPFTPDEDLDAVTEAQEATAVEADEEGDECRGSSSSTSSSETVSSRQKSPKSDAKPVRTTGNLSSPDRAASSDAGSTGTGSTARSSDR